MTWEKRLVTVLVAALGVAACATTSPPNEAPAAVTATTAATVAAAASAPSTAPALATPAAAQVDPVAFFRAQEPACARHAATTGNPPVDPQRFAGAALVRDLGGGAYLVRDGRGTELVVEPERGIVLPASGRAGELVPAPYGFGCPESVFVGGADG